MVSATEFIKNKGPSMPILAGKTQPQTPDLKLGYVIRKMNSPHLLNSEKKIKV
jgi:hypothetical protein